jgi:gas vesicle protein
VGHTTSATEEAEVTNKEEQTQFSQSDLMREWLAMCNRMPQPMAGLAARLKHVTPQITDYPNIELVINNQDLLDQLVQIKGRIRKTMALALHNGNIDFTPRLAKVEEVKDKIGDAANEAVGKVDTLINDASQKLTETTDAVAGQIDSVVNNLSSKADDLVNKAKDTANKVKEAAEKALNEIGNKLEGGLNNFLGDLSDITSRAPSVDSALSTANSLTDGLIGGSEAAGSENDSFHGKIEVGGKKYGIVECRYRFFQQYDSTGKPSTRPRGGAITFIMPSLSDDNVFFYKWMFSKTQVYSGVLKFVVYSQKNKRSYKTVNFKNAYCTELEDYFNDHDSRLMHTRVTIAAEQIIVGSNDQAEFNNDWT